MKFKQAAQLITDLPNTQSVLLLGPPGIGKTALAVAVGSAMASNLGLEVVEGHTINPNDTSDTARCIVEVRDLCSHLPEDLLGLPMPNGDYTQYCPPAWLKRLSHPKVHGVLVLDDLAAASPAIQTAAFKLVLERRSGDCVLSPNVKIIATSNRRSDKSGATELPAALRNRCLITTLDVDTDEWCLWAARNGIPGEIPAFLRYKPQFLSKLPQDADEERGAFATPRTWEMVGRALEAAKKHDRIHDVAIGLVGEGVGVEFAAFCRLRAELPDPKRILMDPVGAMPNPPNGRNADRLIAVVTAISECAAPLSVEKTKQAAEIPALLLTALNHVTQGGREYAGAGILTYSANGGNVAALIKTAREGRDDPRFRDLLKHLKGSLLPGS